MKRLRLLLGILLCWNATAWATEETFTTPGDAQWVAPTGVTSVVVECWGGGGAGSRSTNANVGRGGGGGGGYGRRTMAVTPGLTYNYHVGAGGIDGTTPVNGESSTFTGNAAVQCIGTGASSKAVNSNTSGTGATGSTGDVTFVGGAGAARVSTTQAGGGGEGAGPASVGSAASGSTGGTGTAGGDGGSGGTCAAGVGVAGGPGSQPGGGGAGACMGSVTQDGGAGGAGMIRLTYTPPAPASDPRRRILPE